MASSPERLQWRRQLRKFARKIEVDIASGKLTNHPACSYPTCGRPRVTDDCCYTHALDSHASRGAFLSNDGVIDWQAIDVTRRGERVVSLTWVEYEIAGAYMLLDGLAWSDIHERTGVRFSDTGSRRDRMKGLADALRAAA